MEVNMIGNYKIVTLCGSTKFKDEFMEIQKKLTLEGNIVISVGLFGHSGDNEVWSEGTKEMLDDMHKRKIDMADEIFVINKNGYIGSSTRSEIEYAVLHNKIIKFLE
jgi:NAD(P)H-nitrite reductase large subunit